MPCQRPTVLMSIIPKSINLWVNLGIFKIYPGSKAVITLRPDSGNLAYRHTISALVFALALFQTHDPRALMTRHKPYSYPDNGDPYDASKAA